MTILDYAIASSETKEGEIMQRTLFECPEHPHEWRLEEIDMDDEGQVYQTIFKGPDSATRAAEYASWRGGITDRRLPHQQHLHKSVGDHA